MVIWTPTPNSRAARLATRRLLASVLALVALTSPTFAQQSATAAKLSPIETLKARFRTEYVSARKKALERVGPVILVFEGDKVVLLRKGTREEVQFAPPS